MSVSDADMVEFRVATLDDLPRLTELFDDAIDGASMSAGEDQFRDAVARISRDPASELVVGVLQRTIVCCAQLSLVPIVAHGGHLHARIDGVRVASHPMERGFAHALIAYCVEHARAAGAAVVEIFVDRDHPDSKRLYAELGFEPTHHGMTRRL